MSLILLSIALISLGILVAGWVWYPARMASLGRLSLPSSEDERVSGDSRPPVSVVLATRESTAAILARLADLRNGSYPSELLEILVALDGAHADRRDELQNALGTSARVVVPDTPGKAAALSAGVAATQHDLLLFIDTAQTFADDVVDRLVSKLQDQKWGAATAMLAPTSGDALMDRYWQRELDIRVGQMMHHSVICVTGCAYIMRRVYWSSMPTGLICDDLWSTYSVVTNGARVALVRDALVTDPRRFSREQEFSRRLRTMTGMLQFVRWFPVVVHPVKNPMFRHFLLHKLVRPATPVLLVIAAVCTMAAILLWSPALAFVLLVLGVLALALPWLLVKVGPPAIARPAGNILFAQRLMLMPFDAIGRAVRSDWDIWRPHK